MPGGTERRPSGWAVVAAVERRETVAALMSHIRGSVRVILAQLGDDLTPDLERELRHIVGCAWEAQIVAAQPED